MLRLEDVSASYRGLRALQGVSLDVARGEIVAVVGANGAGKSTLLKSIAGQVATEGTIEFEGQSLRRLPAHRITRLGVSMVPEGRRLFPRLSVEDNLRLGAYAKRGADRFKPLELVFSLFPRLQERLCAARRNAVGRRAADAGDRSRVDDAAAVPDARRAEPGHHATAGR